MTTEKNYTVGAGKIYFDPFLPGTETTTGERYVGNTPSLSVSSTYQDLPHYDADNDDREMDDHFTLQTDRTLTFSLDHISMENVGVMWGSAPEDETTAAVSAVTETLTGVLLGRYYQLGVSADTPDGVGTVANASAGISPPAATGTITVGGQPIADATVTINGQAITFVASGATDFECNIGATTGATAHNIKNVINTHQAEFDVSATVSGNTVTLTALDRGVGGNAITLAEAVADAGFTISGATLDGGAAGSGIGPDGNYEVDLVQGRVHIFADAVDIADGDDLDFVYDTVLQTRSVVVEEGKPVEGAVRFIADNRKGTNKNHYWPRVKLQPTGEFALKSETWQNMAFSGMVLLPSDGRRRVYVREVAA